MVPNYHQYEEGNRAGGEDARKTATNLAHHRSLHTLPCAPPCHIEDLHFFVPDAKPNTFRKCFAESRLVFLGDSVLTELASEFLLMMSRREPRVSHKWLELHDESDSTAPIDVASERWLHAGE